MRPFVFAAGLTMMSAGAFLAGTQVEREISAHYRYERFVQGLFHAGYSNLVVRVNKDGMTGQIPLPSPGFASALAKRMESRVRVVDAASVDYVISELIGRGASNFTSIILARIGDTNIIGQVQGDTARIRMLSLEDLRRMAREDSSGLSLQ